MKKSISEEEKVRIVEALKSNQYNVRRTAKQLGVPKSTLHDRILAFRLRDYRERAQG